MCVSRVNIKVQAIEMSKLRIESGLADAQVKINHQSINAECCSSGFVCSL